MVDVWKELGKSLGRAFKPISDIPAAIWKSLGDAAGDLIEGFLGAAKDLGDATKPTINRLITSAVDEMTISLGADSPPEEIEEAITGMVNKLLATIEEESKTEGHSLPTRDELLVRQGTLITKVLGMYAATHAVAMALDSSQPIKDWGFKSAVMDMMYQFNMREVVGPMIQAPIYASVVMPMRMYARARNPYEIPASGTLPYLLAKDIINDATYKQNMAYHAFSSEWADMLLENVYRYPGFGDVRTMIHRGVKTWEDARAALEKSLTHSDYLDAYEALLPSVPGAGDLVDMVVREAFQERSGDEEMSERFVTEMAKQGFDREACLWFWRKHWVLPGVGLVYDMYHRGIAMPQTIDEFLKVADYAPEWRTPLEELSWNLPGRIEARWMVKWNEVGVDELRVLLEKGGLSPEWSERVSRAVTKNQFLADINREVINRKTDFAKGYIIEDTLRSDLTALGLNPIIVDYHVIDAVADRERSEKDKKLTLLKKQYSSDAVTMAEVLEAAEKIIVDKTIRDVWIAALPSAKEEKIVEETYTTEVNRLVANAKSDYVKGYIVKDELVRRLTNQGIPTERINYHVLDADEDRTRKRNDERLTVIKDAWMKDEITDFEQIEALVAEVIVDEEAAGLWLDDAWFDKFKTVTR